ncbi:MAG: Gfo/Idh/MocA family oxidoreductase [Rhodospirillales bacterium]|nr:Gfo/Idh/MocA family oxidoreductase [Rhodospirillales bacterium]
MDPTVGFIGLGVMGQRMLGNMNTFGGFILHAGWDPDPAACRQAQALVPGFSIAEDPFALINDPALDLVYIACPPAHHKIYAMAAIAAGKAIYCEKPLGIDLSESQGLVDAVEAAGNKHCVNFSLASAAAVECMESALADGSIGAVQAVDIHLHFSTWPRDWQVPAAWLSERAEGGFVRETFSHYAYLCQRLFGPVTVKSATTRYPDDAVSAETQCLAALDCAGIPISFMGGTGGIHSSGADKVAFTIWGAKAVYRLYDWNRLRTNSGDGWTEQLTDIADLREEGYRRALINVGRLLRDEAHGLPDFRAALAVQTVVEDILSRRQAK